MSFRVTQISDTHLSARRAWGVPNFRAVARHLAADPPDLVINTGDVALDDPDDDGDAAFARELHDELPSPWLVIPGNHDVGDNGATPWQGQAPTEERLERWAERWGADRFSIDLEGWRLVGANNLLVGTGLAAEQEQAEWLRHHLAGAERVALFIHKPICLTHPDADDGRGGPLELPWRRAFWSLVEGSAVRLVASGHLHRYRQGTLPGGIRTVWAPTTAFLGQDRGDGAVRSAGMVDYVFDGDDVTVELVRPEGVTDFAVGDVMEQYGSLRFAPPLEAGA